MRNTSTALLGSLSLLSSIVASLTELFRSARGEAVYERKANKNLFQLSFKPDQAAIWPHDIVWVHPRSAAPGSASADVTNSSIHGWYDSEGKGRAWEAAPWGPQEIRAAKPKRANVPHRRNASENSRNYGK